jgi:hypothetical protein
VYPLRALRWRLRASRHIKLLSLADFVCLRCAAPSQSRSLIPQFSSKSSSGFSDGKIPHPTHLVVATEKILRDRSALSAEVARHVT